MRCLPSLLVVLLAAGCVEHGLTPITDPPKGGEGREDTAWPAGFDTGEPDPIAPDTGAVDLDDPADDLGEPLPCSGAVRTVRHEVVFPARSSCVFGRGDNLAAVDAVVSARETQGVETGALPDAALCDIRFEFAESQGGMSFPLRYDDQLMLTLNQRVVFASDERMVHALPEDGDGFARFDWAALRGMGMDFAPVPWALGPGPVLELPSHDVQGDAFVQIEDEPLGALRGVADGAITFELHSFGDNDPTDCGHTGLAFWVELDFDQP